MKRRDDAPSPPGAEAVAFVPVGEVGTTATTFTCSLCGSRFAHGTLVCTSCPMNVGCDIVKCPNCGYQFPRTSRIVEWAKRLTRRPRRGGSLPR